MKTFKLFISCLLLSSFAALAQYNNGYGRSNRLPTTEAPKPTPEALEKQKIERIEKTVTKLKEDLSLDELQVIAIRNEIVSSSKSIDILMKSEIPDEDKGKQYIAIQEKTDKNILNYLNATQKEKFQKLKEEKVAHKDGKKKKREKDNEAEKE